MFYIQFSSKLWLPSMIFYKITNIKGQIQLQEGSLALSILVAIAFEKTGYNT